MPIPIVAVEIAPADSQPQLVEALVAACSNSVAIGDCVLAGREAEAVEPSAVAIVSWQTSEQVRIEVGIRREQSAKWLTQRLLFRKNDAPSERWRAVGLAIGTLVGELGGATKAPTSEGAGVTGGEPAPAQQDALRSTASGERPSANRAGIWLDLGALAGPGLDSGEVRRGGFLRSSFRPQAWPVFLGLSIDYAVRPTDETGVRVEWATVALGVGHGLDASAGRLGAELRVDALLQHVRVSATESETGRAGSADTSLVGARAGISGNWMFAPPLGLLIGGEVSALSASVDVRTRDQPQGTAASVQYGFVAGLRVRMD